MRTGTLVVELVVVRCRARPTQLRAEQLSRGGIIHEYLGIPIIPSFYGLLLLNLRGVGLVVELISELDDRLSLVKLRASQKEWVKITGPCFNRCSPQWMDGLGQGRPDGACWNRYRLGRGQRLGNSEVGSSWLEQSF